MISNMCFLSHDELKSWLQPPYVGLFALRWCTRLQTQKAKYALQDALLLSFFDNDGTFQKVVIPHAKAFECEFLFKSGLVYMLGSRSNEEQASYFMVKDLVELGNFPVSANDTQTRRGYKHFDEIDRSNYAQINIKPVTIADNTNCALSSTPNEVDPFSDFNIAEEHEQLLFNDLDGGTRTRTM